MTPEEREKRRYARAEARERKKRLAFWASIPLGERERLVVWFAKQFGLDSDNKTEKPAKPARAAPILPKALISDGTTIDQLTKIDVSQKGPPLHPRVSKEKPPWWKR